MRDLIWVKKRAGYIFLDFIFFWGQISSILLFFITN